MILLLHIVVASTALLATLVVLARTILGKKKLFVLSDTVLISTAGTIGTGAVLIINGAPLGRVCLQALALTVFSFATLFYESRVSSSNY